VFLRKDAVEVWSHTELDERLIKYQQIFKKRILPRYILAKNFKVGFDVNNSITELLELHNEKGEEFRLFVSENQEKTPKEFYSSNKNKQIEKSGQSYLRLKIEILKKIIKNCEFCENKCHVDRTKGELGRCKVDDKAYVASAFTHLGEESPIVPSGTIFFYGCTMKCVFCQNYDISQEYSLNSFRGRETSPYGLSLIISDMVKQKDRNINFVGGEPTPNLHIILEAMELSTEIIPMLWNSNMYLSEKVMKIIVDIFDIWLPDMKYGNNKCAEKYSKVQNYWPTLKRNMKMIESLGSGEYIIRHLVMPNHLECCSFPILQWIKENLKTSLVNIMGQYRPMYKVGIGKYEEINRRPVSVEMRQVKDYADNLGLRWRSVS